MKRILTISAFIILALTASAQTHDTQKSNNKTNNSKEEEELEAGFGLLLLLGALLGSSADLFISEQPTNTTNSPKQDSPASSSTGKKSSMKASDSNRMEAKSPGKAAETASKAAKFNSTNPEINPVNFVQYPFGLTSLDKGSVSEQDFFNAMRNSFPKMKESKSQLISHYYDYGKDSTIPLAYKGKDMNLAAAYFDEATGTPLMQYVYTFTFDKKKYQKDEVIQFANQILNDLYNGGITMARNGNKTTRMDDFGEVKGKNENNDIILSSNEESTYDYEVRIIVTRPLRLKR